MHWKHVGTGLLALTMMTGCPSEFGKEGRVDRAAHKDSLELVRRRCSPEEVQRYCAHGRENSKECRDKCG